MTSTHSSTKVRFPTYLQETVQGNDSDYANDHANDHNGARLKPQLTWSFDFSVAKHTQVVSVADGVVVYVQMSLSEPSGSGKWSGYGNVITVRSVDAQGGFFYETYAHLEYSSSPLVHVDQTIRAGSSIAYSGDTGTYFLDNKGNMVAHPHLHIQFGSTTYLPYLNTTNSSNNYGPVADGQYDSISPAYFDNMTMNFKGSLNITDKVYVGTAGADIFIANDNGDTVVTDGGGDNITLGAAGHADRVELYVGTGAAVSSIVAAVPGSITDSADVAKGGFWGLAGGVGQFGGLATGHGTSTDMTKIFNFQSGSATGADVIDLSASAWGSGGTNGEKGTNRGLVNGNLLNHPTTMTFASLHINGTVPSSANMIRLVDRTFADANAVAQALSSNYKISLGASLPSLADCHMLFAYNDSSNYARIADVEFNNNSYAASSASTSLAVHASDLVQITGISMSQLYTNNLHFVT